MRCSSATGRMAATRRYGGTRMASMLGRRKAARMGRRRDTEEPVRSAWEMVRSRRLMEVCMNRFVFRVSLSLVLLLPASPAFASEDTEAMLRMFNAQVMLRNALQLRVPANDPLA